MTVVCKGEVRNRNWVFGNVERGIDIWLSAQCVFVKDTTL